MKKRVISKVIAFMFIVGGLGISNSLNISDPPSPERQAQCQSDKGSCNSSCRSTYGPPGECDEGYYPCILECWDDYWDCLWSE